MLPLAAAAIAGPLLGGIIGSASASKARAQAMQMAQMAAAQFDGIVPPEVRALIVQEFQRQGTYSPEIEQAIDLGQSQVSQIKEDPVLRGRQMEVLQSMAQRGKTGLNPEDRAALNQVRSETQRDIEAKRQQILQNAQARGIGGSGVELAMQIAASQEGADRASQESDRVQATASQNALQALFNTGSMAGNIRSQDFSADQARAEAEDQFRRLSYQNQQGVQGRNVGTRNEAQRMNLGEAQRVYESNINRQRDEELRQEKAKQDKFTNQMDLARGKADAYSGMAGMLNRQGQQKADMWQGIGTGVGTMAGSIFSNSGSKDDSPSRVAAGDNSGSGYFGGSSPRSSGRLSLFSDTPGHYKGGEVEGEAPIEGDHPANDIVHARLSPGEIVLPRSVTESDNPAKEAAKFVKDLKQRASVDVNGFLTKLSLNRKQ